MDRRSWLWRKRSSEKSPGETESSGSMSSYSERLSDEQANITYNAQSPELTYTAPPDGEENDKIKALTEKLSAALLSITAKEELVIQHAKVAEEAVAGWESADREASGLKLQLDAALKKNSGLEDRVSHLDGALKECVRQLRQGKEEQERKIEEAIAKREHETKSELENQMSELRTQLEAANKSQVVASASMEKASLIKKLEITTLERDLSTQSAETASKQHLESIKKVAKLEGECRRLRFLTRKGSLFSEHRSFTASSVTDSQSDYGDQNEHIGEFDEFKGEKATRSSETLLMDDFLEMERLAALPNINIANGPSDVVGGENQLKAEIEAMMTRNAHLEEKITRLEAEKMELEMALNESHSRHFSASVELSECQAQLRTSQGQLKGTKTELNSLQHELFECRDQLRTSQAKLKSTETELIELQTQLIEYENQLSTSDAKLVELQDQIKTCQGQLEDAEAEIKRAQGLVKDIESQLLEMQTKLIEYEDKLEKMEDGDTKLVELQTELALVNKLKEGVEGQLEASNAQRQEAELQVKSLLAKVESLVDEADKERALSAQITDRCLKLDDELSRSNVEPQFQLEWNCNADMVAEQEKELAVAASRLEDCQNTIASLGRQLQSLATLDDFLVDADTSLEFTGESPIFFRTGELGNPHSIDQSIHNIACE